MWIILLVLACVAGFYVYNKILLPKMNQKAEEKHESSKGKFISQISGHEDEVRNQYLKSSDSVSPIAKQMNEEPIEAIISCMQLRNIKDATRQALTNVAGQAVGKLVGVGFKQTDNEEHYYLGLCPNTLHYLHFSDEGACKEHLTFDRSRMENVETGKVTATEAATISADMFETSRFSFTYNGDAYKFFYFHRFYAHPNAEESDDDEQEEKEYTELNYLFAEPFLKFAAGVCPAS